MMIKKILFWAVFFILISTSALAKNIDLVTLPSRDSVQLTIYNSEDLTLVKEARYITVKKGFNRLQFAWSGTLIDPTSVEFRPIEYKDQIELADTTILGQKPQHLIWNIESKYEGQVKVEVSYFTSGLTWSMDYIGETDPEEELMKFRGYVRVYNNSGEEYEDAEVRLIVGHINLVEKIAELARRYGISPPAPVSPMYPEMRKKAALESFDEAERAMQYKMAAPAMALPAAAPKGIVKEGLSEYFMFSVEGRETIPDGWSKRMLAVKADEVNFNVMYRMRTEQYGPEPQRFFIWKNDEKHKLGESPLPDGLIRIFRENGKEGLSYLGEQTIRYVPIMADVEVNLGPDDLVVYETIKKSTKRYNFSFNKHDEVDGWDEEQIWNEIVRNYRNKPITFELRRVWKGDVEYRSKIKTALFDYQTTESTLIAEPRSKNENDVSAVIHMGSNQKQSRVLIKK
ncbi:MAG: hypothetical protein ACMUHX_10065 [bacterium]